MRVVLADLKSNRGFVSKDTVVGGYGSRLDPFSRVTAVMAYLKKQFHDVPSVHMAYIAAILARAGHEVKWTRGEHGRRRRRARAVVAGRSQERNRVGRRDARARRQGRVHRHHGVEDAGAVRGSLRLHPQRRARSGGHAAGAGRDPAAASSSASRSTISIRCRFRAGIWSPRIARKLGIQVVRRVRSAAAIPLLASRGCPEFCTYCPHRILAGYRARSIANIVDEMERLCDQVSAAVRHLPRSAVHRAARARASSCATRFSARGLTLTFEAETRLDRLDVELLDRLYAAGFRAMSFGVESLDPATLKKSGRRPIPQAHQREIIEHCRKLGHRHGGVLRPRVPAGRLELDRGDDRLRHRSRIDVRAVQDADAVSGHADVQAARAAAHRNGLGEVRRLHADVQASEPDRARAAVPARRGLQALLHAAVVPGELPEDPEHGDPRMGQPDGSRVNERHPRGDRRHLAPVAADTTTRDRDASCDLRLAIACRRHADARISRYGARVLPEHRSRSSRAARPAASSSRARRSPSSKRAFARRAGRPAHAIAAAYGRIAFYYILKALDLPRRIRNHLSGADLLGRAGAGARRRAEGRVRRRRSGDVQHRSRRRSSG